jgi:hypothetical protein
VRADLLAQARDCPLTVRAAGRRSFIDVMMGRANRAAEGTVRGLIVAMLRVG